MSNQDFYFKTWDEMYYLQKKQSAKTQESQEEINRFADAFSERATYLFENDAQFRKDYQDYTNILSNKELSSDPELIRKKKIMSQIDAACKPLSDDPIKAAKQKIIRLKYEKRLKENHLQEASKKEGIEVLSSRKKRVVIDSSLPKNRNNHPQNDTLKKVILSNKTYTI